MCSLNCFSISITLTFFSILICLHCCVNANASYKNLDNEQALFEKYIVDYQKTYLKGTDEYQYRFQNFLASLERINLKNKEVGLTHRIGINKFSDLSAEEFKERYLSTLLFPYLTTASNEELNLITYTPSKLDWRDNHTVTPVKNQETCGGCWAFTTVEVVESAWAIAGNKLVPLSIQQVIDCDKNAYGCRGGMPCSTLQWLKQSKTKLVEDSLYPFHDAAGTCRNVSARFGVGVSEYFCESCQGNCPSYEMKNMIPKLVKYGPLAVAVDAISWQDYTGGIIQHHCSHDQPDHSVQIVGYDLTGKIPYWIVRNSWGADFGDHGYLYIKIGENMCGVANFVAGVAKVHD